MPETKRNRWKKLLIGTAVLLSVALIISVLLYAFHAERILLKPLMTGKTVPEDYGDIIVVFGGGMRKDMGVQIGYSTLERLDLAVGLYKRREMPILVSDGSLYRRSPAIPLVMNYLLQRGVQRERILVEGESQTTRDNVARTVEIVQGLGLKEMIVCTSPYHQRRCQLLMEKAEVEGFLLAEANDSEVFHAVSFGQRIRAFHLIAHEYLALLFLWVGGLF